jgi:phosphoglucomutase
MKISPLAGHPPPQAMLLDVAKLVTAYYAEIPDPSVPVQRVAFGTSGHRGSSFEKTFNEWHVLAISEAICRYRRQQGIGGPLFLGFDTHALSVPACTTAVEVLAATASTSCSPSTTHTPRRQRYRHPDLQPRTQHGAGRRRVVTPSHNPPTHGGSAKPQWGPADSRVTSWIEAQAKSLLERGLDGETHSVREGARVPHAPARLFNAYVRDLGNHRYGGDPGRGASHLGGPSAGPASTIGFPSRSATISI